MERRCIMKEKKDKIQKEGPGAPNIMEKYEDLTNERLMRTYQVFKTCRRTAKVLGMHHSTVSKWLKKNGIIPIDSGWDFINSEDIKPRHYRKRKGAFAKWLEDNPNTKLPANIKKISLMTGVSYDAVRNYFRQNHKRMKTLTEKYLGDNGLIKLNLPLEAVDNSGDIFVWYTSKLSLYTVTLNKFKEEFLVVGLVNADGKTFRVNYRPYSYLEFIKLLRPKFIGLEIDLYDLDEIGK
jgi:hypothetical protein